MSAPELHDAVGPPEPPPGVLSPDDGGPSTGNQPVSPAPVRPTTESSRIGRSLWWVVVVVLAVGVLLAVVAILSKLGGHNGTTPFYVNHPPGGASSSSSTATTTPPPPPGSLLPLAISSATSFDPDPGSGDENPAEAPLAIDGDPTTSWSTLTYYGGPRFGGTKPGVGLVVDLGRQQTIGAVRVRLVGSPTSFEVRAAPATATTAPAAAADDYTLVGQASSAGTFSIVRLAEPVRTRFVLVWLTSIPPVSGGYEGKVAEIQVLG